jgi:hypothetical protein
MKASTVFWWVASVLWLIFSVSAMAEGEVMAARVAVRVCIIALGVAALKTWREYTNPGK